ncbi:MAG: hypothetical protein ABSD03_15820 [Vulcanimicrobiaceae bacterium]|jgi:hypothetical protein
MASFKYAPGEMEQRVAGIHVNSALFSAIREGSDFEDDRCFEIAALLQGLVNYRGRILRDKNAPALALKREREMCARIDQLHRDGAPWPRWASYSSSRMNDRPVNVRHRVRRKPSPRPERGYCVRWTGGYWIPCFTGRERREAGYVGLPMCWPPPVQEVGAYIWSGERARFVYRICEVERVEKPRSAKRYTCRLWCDRVLPEDVPADAVRLTFYWHPRAKAKQRQRRRAA